MTDSKWPSAPIIQAACRDENGDLWDAGIWQREPEGAYLLLYNGLTAKPGYGIYFTNVTEYWPDDPTVYALPEEPAGPVWDTNGDKWERDTKPDKSGTRYWQKPGVGMASGRVWPALLRLNGPLSTVPPARTWHVGDTVNTTEEADTLPAGTITRGSDNEFLHRYDTGWQEPGYDGTTAIGQCEYPLTILWLPKETS